MRREARLGLGLTAVVSALLAAACTAPAEQPAPPPTSPTTAPSRTVPPMSATPTPTLVEPTTTNTLPPPPQPTGPAPTRAGVLTKKSLPVPAGWRTVVREGGLDEGFQGNGTWVLGRDPRYAAFETVTVGCAPVTRDDYTDPVAALEGTYERRDQPGIGLALQFADAAAATRYLGVYRRQLEQCTDPDLLQARLTSSALGLVDRRSAPDGDWTEVIRQTGPRLTLIILADPGHKITDAQTSALLKQIGTTGRR